LRGAEMIFADSTSGADAALCAAAVTARAGGSAVALLVGPCKLPFERLRQLGLLRPRQLQGLATSAGRHSEVVGRDGADWPALAHHETDGRAPAGSPSARAFTARAFDRVVVGSRQAFLSQGREPSPAGLQLRHVTSVLSWRSLVAGAGPSEADTNQPKGRKLPAFTATYGASGSSFRWKPGARLRKIPRPSLSSQSRRSSLAPHVPRTQDILRCSVDHEVGRWGNRRNLSKGRDSSLHGSHASPGGYNASSCGLYGRRKLAPYSMMLTGTTKWWAAWELGQSTALKVVKLAVSG
jgi:hypothetical protein